MIKIFNTLSGYKEDFKINKNKQVNIYVCGITPSDYMHIGHARTFIMFDIVIRYLNFIGYKTYYLRNITDVSEKILSKALENKIKYNLYTFKIIEDLINNFNSLNILPPNKEIRISNLIQHSISLIKRLINKNCAYIDTEGNVRFNINIFKQYGKLSKQVIENLYKDNLDFVLWKKNHQEINGWPSPWGYGSPGWHTGCFTIINEYINNKNLSLDIHGGGNDLIFPHHENELTQFECLYNKSYVKIWMHIGLILINNEKMSKSLNNFFYVKDFLQKYNPEILRTYFIMSHYRKNMEFTFNGIQNSKNCLEKLYATIYQTNKNVLVTSDLEIKYDFFFFNSMNNDFNTVECFSILLDMAKKIQFYYVRKHHGFANSLKLKLRQLANILGLLTQDPHCFFKNVFNYFKKNNYIEFLIKKRNNARKEKKWIIADKIRDELKKINIFLEDNIKGTIWRYNNNNIQ